MDEQQTDLLLDENLDRLRQWTIHDGGRHPLAAALAGTAEECLTGRTLSRCLRAAFTWELTGDGKELRLLTRHLMIAFARDGSSFAIRPLPAGPATKHRRVRPARATTRTDRARQKQR